MVDIRCPNCGKYNPADRDLCQFCYTKLKATGDLPPASSEDLMNMLGGESEAEDVPDWLQELTPEDSVSPFVEGDQEKDLESLLPEDWLPDTRQPEQPQEREDLFSEAVFGTDDTSEESVDETVFEEPPLESESPFMPDAFDFGDQAESQGQGAFEAEEGEPESVSPESFFAESDLDDDWLDQLGLNAADPSEEQDSGPPDLEPTPPSEPGPDSESDTIEETMDWLSSLETEGAEDELSDEPPTILETPAEVPSMDWFSESAESEADEESTPGLDLSPQPSESGANIDDWLAGLDGETGLADDEVIESEAPAAEAEDEQPDWLSRLGTGDLEQAAAEAPDLFAPQDEVTGLEMAIDAQGESAAEPEDWFEGDESVSSADFAFETDDEAGEELPDWLQSATSQPYPETADEGQDAPFASPFSETSDDFEPDEEADWFAESGQPEPVQETPATESDVPDWLREAGEGASPFGSISEPEETEEEWTLAAPEEPTSFAEELDDTPEWLREMGEPADRDHPADREQPADEELASAEEPAVEPSFASFEVEEEEVPDWLSNLDQSTPAPSEADSIPAFVVDEELSPFDEPEPDEDFAPAAAGETPDWLNQITSGEDLPPVEIGEPEAQPAVEESVQEAELPEWLEAMRPSEEAGTGVPFQDTSDDRVEAGGFLAGVPGILSAEYDIDKVAKPPTYSVKLQVPEDHQVRVDLLKSLLEEEEQAAPAEKSTALPTTYILRMIILGAFILGAAFAFWTGVQQTPLPDASLIPQPVADLGSAVAALPENAPVLIAFDYEPGSIPELEAAALGIIDQLLAKGSTIRTVSTNNTGPALAKLMLDKAVLMTERADLASSDIAHLGYIPGGPSGLQAFSRDPAGLMHYDLDSAEGGEMNAWQSPSLNPEAGLANFALVMVIADNTESARGWIEQSGSKLLENQVPLVMIISAQIEPLVLPYYYTNPRQVAGVATGVMGGVYLESLSGITGPAGTLLDAYSLTLAVAVVLILIGSLVHLISGQLKSLQNLRNEGEA